MKIEDKNKQHRMGLWLNKTGNGIKRRPRPTTVKAREYMHTPPYCGIFNSKVEK